MYRSLVASPAELSELKLIFEDYCHSNGIVDNLGRDTVAHRLIVMYGQGTRTKADLLAGLNSQP